MFSDLNSWVRTKQLLLISAGIATITFVGLLLFRSVAQEGDSLNYAYSATTGLEMFNPHHLLFTPSVFIIHKFLWQVCQSCNAIFAAQVFNAVWASVAVVSTFLVVVRLVGSKTSGLFAALLLLVFAGFWKFASQAEVYISALGALSVVVLILVDSGERLLTQKHIVALSILLSLAIFFHQTNVLFVIPLGTYLFMTQGKHAAKIWISLCCLTGIIVTVVYVLVYIETEGGLSLFGLLQFVTRYAHEPIPSWGTFSYLSPRGVYWLANSQLLAILWFPKSMSIAIVPAFSLGLLALFMWNLRQIVLHRSHSGVRAFMFAWLVTYFLFFLWWLPIDSEFFIATLFPITVLLFLSISDLPQGWRLQRMTEYPSLLAVSVVALLMVATWYSTIKPSRASLGKDYERAAELASLTREECLVILHRYDYGIHQNLKFYFDRTVVLLEPLVLKFYRNERFQPEYQQIQAPCIVIPVRYIEPDYLISEEFDAYSHPAEWISFIGWLFDYEESAQSSKGSARSFEVITTVVGRQFIYLKQDRVAFDSTRQLMSTIDDQIDQSKLSDERPFGDWLSKVQ